MSAEAVPLQIRGRFLTAVVVPVAGRADDGFYAALDMALRTSPQFFANAPLVIDVGEAAGLDTEDEFRALLRRLRSRQLTPFGIQNASTRQSLAASGAGLTTLQAGRDAPVEEPRPRPVEAIAAPAEPPPAPATIVTEPVRSGQCIVAERGDLVVVAPVSSGAELIAHGNIHVYGRLRGRALAGVHGDRTARIFAQGLEAELIAIAGLYKTNEAIGPDVAGQRVQAFLEEDALRIAPLK